MQVVPKVELRERAISSTAIREAVELGDLAGASAMLGRPVAVLGSVVRGDALGRQLGFPTANLDLHHALHPPVGVYAARARLQGETQALHPAVVNIGFRPTLDRPPATPLCTHAARPMQMDQTNAHGLQHLAEAAERPGSANEPAPLGDLVRLALGRRSGWLGAHRGV